MLQINPDDETSLRSGGSAQRLQRAGQYGPQRQNAAADAFCDRSGETSDAGECTQTKAPAGASDDGGGSAHALGQWDRAVVGRAADQLRATDQSANKFQSDQV